MAQFIRCTNIILSCMCKDQATSTVAWHLLITSSAAVRPHPVCFFFLSTSVRHKSAKTARHKQLIPAGLRSGLHKWSQILKLVLTNVADFKGGVWPRLWRCGVTAGCGTSQHLSIQIVSSDDRLCFSVVGDPRSHLHTAFTNRCFSSASPQWSAVVQLLWAQSGHTAERDCPQSECST